MNWSNLLSDFRLRESTRTPDSRNSFESDFGRIIFSPATRRMHDKTQVFPLTADDNIHSRLTHSMEVMAIGHSLGIKVCEDAAFVQKLGRDTTQLYREIPIVLKNACLLHDIGNPPFGHFGEAVFQNYFKNYFEINPNFKLSNDNEEDKLRKEDFTFFDGNAQGLRVITKLQILNDKYGLNLTVATLGAYVKYPNSSEKNNAVIHKKKRGIFQSEVEYYNQIAQECGLKIENEYVRHPLCYLMEAADSICYLTMDIEDGYNKGWYDFDFIVEKLSHVSEIKESAAKIKGANIGPRAEITWMVKFRIELISRLVALATKNFLNNYEKIIAGEYNDELIADDSENLAKELGKFCYNVVFTNREITSLELTGHSVVTGLLDIYINFVFHKEEAYRNRAAGLISDSIIQVAIEENKQAIFTQKRQKLEEKKEKETDPEKKAKIEKDCTDVDALFVALKQLDNELSTETDGEKIKSLKYNLLEVETKICKIISPSLDDLDNYYKLRVIVDFISGMTDQFALSHYQKLSGQKIS